VLFNITLQKEISMLQRESFFGRQDAKPENNSTKPGATPAPANVRSSLSHEANDESQRAARASASKEGEGRGSQLIVGPNIRMKGVEITDCDTLVVEGHIEATMDSRMIQIAPGGTFQGTAGLDSAEIRGSFTGELTVRKTLTVYATGRVSGKITYKKLIVEEGGEIAGEVSKLADDGKSVRSSPSTSSSIRTGQQPAATSSLSS
jgi:cytoskeletal protein CcmA (bactofilin family)